MIGQRLRELGNQSILPIDSQTPMEKNVAAKNDVLDFRGAHNEEIPFESWEFRKFKRQPGGVGDAKGVGDH